MNIATLLQELVNPVSSDYDFLLAVSTDTLYVLDKNKEVVEVVIEGNDYDAYVCSCRDEDHFLYVLHAIKTLINEGENPLNYINLSL